MYWYSFSSTIEIFFCGHNTFSRFFLNSKWIFSQVIFISRTFPELLKFQDISRTWKMNLLFSRFCRTRGNPVVPIVFDGADYEHDLIHIVDFLDSKDLADYSRPCRKKNIMIICSRKRNIALDQRTSESQNCFNSLCKWFV